MCLCVDISGRQHFTEFFLSPFPPSLRFFFYSCTLTYFRCIHSLFRQLKLIWTGSSTVETVRGHQHSFFSSSLLVLTLTLSPVFFLSMQANFFFVSSHFFPFVLSLSLPFSLCLIQCYYGIYTFKVPLLYMGTLCKLSHTF